SAFTHTSWADERSDSYERLEFLGDSVLELALADALFHRFPDFDEGQMAKVRSHVVSRASCAVVARELGLGEKLIETAAEAAGGELTRLAGNRNVLAAVLEAALAALYLEHGFEAIAPAIVAAFESRVDFALTNQVDHKTELQETLARRGRSVTYALLNAEGPRRVHLKAVKLRGFKSFVDPVEVRLEPGVAVVVGPNGSGKSNISDSILWATGSLSPHELRAEKPDDVLFAGSAGRKPVDF